MNICEHFCDRQVRVAPLRALDEGFASMLKLQCRPLEVQQMPWYCCAACWFALPQPSAEQGSCSNPTPLSPVFPAQTILARLLENELGATYVSGSLQLVASASITAPAPGKGAWGPVTMS